MAVIHMTRYRIEGTFPYLPWPEMRHAAWSLRRIAREHPRGSAHTISAAVVMTAFSVEAFCQTVGPQVLVDIWTSGKYPAERWSVLDKLKEIGKRTGSTINYGEAPWSEIKELFKARDRLAHAKPEEGKVDRIIDVPDGIDVVDYYDEIREREFQSLHDVDRLERLAGDIDTALLPIWIAAGNTEGSFIWKGLRHFKISAP